MASAPQSPLLELHAVEKSFGGARALRPLDWSIAPAEVVGLIGENGAGKSTLIKILCGVHSPDAGELRWQGRSVQFGSPHDAMSAGIATIHQELAYCGPLTVAENLFLGEPWPRTRWGGVDWAKLQQDTRDRLGRFDLDLDPSTTIDQLSAAQKQEIAIARALSRQAQLLILDEPTASLSEPEVRRLFKHLARLRDSGMALLYVSHRLDEILELTHRVCVLRDGAKVAEYPTHEATVERMVRDMVGRDMEAFSEEHNESRARTSSDRPVVLELREATHSGLFEHVSFQAHAGEIVGLAGLVGAGRSELARAIFGMYPLTSGSMSFRGQPWHPASPAESIREGITYVPEERKRQGLVLDHGVGESISIGFSDQLVRLGMIPARVESSRIEAALSRLGVKTAGPSQPIGTLSGGNQQKAILARWLDRDPELLLLDEPTRGVDVGAKAEIHQLIRQLADRGKTVLLISSDLPEVLGLSDRVLVMHEGRITAELKGQDRTQERALMAASGQSIPA